MILFRKRRPRGKKSLLRAPRYVGQAEVSGQKAEIRNQKSEVRGQRSETKKRTGVDRSQQTINYH